MKIALLLKNCFGYRVRVTKVKMRDCQDVPNFLKRFDAVQRRTEKSKLLIGGACLLLLVLTGCASYLLPSAKQIAALAKDTNSIHIVVNTIYGTVQFDRNMGAGAMVPVTFQVKPAP